MPRFARLSLLIFALAALSPYAARAASLEPQNYRRAFAALEAGHADLANNIALRGHDAVLNKVLHAYYMGSPGNDASFGEMQAFVAANPDWPNIRDICAIAEQKMPADASPSFVAEWFAAHPPMTLTGFTHYVNALSSSRDTQAAAKAVRTRWINGDFREADLVGFYNRYAATLTRGDHWARVDRLLWNGDATAARRIYSLVDPAMKAVAEARIALVGQKFGAARLLQHVPQEWQADPGLLYERLRWLRRENRDEDADDILEHAPDELGRPDAWWEERQIMVRRAMERRNFRLAYRLAANHGTVGGKGLLEAEFIAGWLALRFLDQPDDARAHFETLFRNATTPVSRARGAYWLGRSLEALDDKSAAEQSYETAAAINVTYYGQLAMTRIYAHPVVTAAPEPAIPAVVRNKFFARDLIRAVAHLNDIGETTLVRVFFHAAVDAADRRSDYVLLSELAYEIKRPDYAIEAAKAANQKNMLVAAGGFPVMEHRLPSPPEPAFTHALIRQESMFNPGASSPAGAQGLMQLMPQTAKGIAKKIGVRYRKSSLGNPDYNVRLGTAFVQSQIESFNGSYILALAGYNAGPARTREWMSAIGDPRNPHVDVIDWIELIPVAETRNYVQRILENLQIYRARLNGGKAPLLILKDLKR